MASKRLQVINVNVNGLRCKIGQVRKFLQNQQHESILILNDTRLRNNLKTSDFPGYTIMRKDKQLVGTTATAGGVAILFPNKWSGFECKLATIGDHFEALAAIIIPLKSNPIKIATCYNRPGNVLPQRLIEEFNEIKFNDRDIPGLFAGDLNCSHQSFGSRITNTYGTNLLQAITKNNLILLNSQTPTYWCSSTGEPNLIDLVFGNNLLCPFFLSCEVDGDVGSDHLPVKTLLDFNVASADEKTRLNFGEWVKKIDEALPILRLDNHTIEGQVEMVEQVFKYTRKECIHKIRRPKRKLPTEIMQIIQERKHLLKMRRQAVTQQERLELSKEYNRVNNKVKRLIQEFESEQQEKLASNICSATDSTTMWKLFKKFKTKNKQIDDPIAPLDLPDGKMTCANTEKSAEFARHLKSVHQTPNNPALDMIFKHEVDEYFETFIPPPPCENAINQIDVKRFRDLLSQTKSNSSPGEDTITYDVMKKSNDQSINTLCTLLNNCLKENVFPSQWKSAKVIMLPKPGKDAKKATSYRPISLLSCLGKIYERHIGESLVGILEERKFFTDLQAGYRKGKSSQEHLFRLTQDIFNGFKERKATIGVFLDVQKAFDAVWLNGLKKKIQNIGLPSQLQNIIFSFLTNRVLRVNENGSVSNLVKLEAGTPQGSCLSPILYIIFVNDLAQHFDQSHVSAGQYADDIGLYSTNRDLKTAEKHVQKALHCVMEWCRKWQVLINTSKSQVVVFTKCVTHRRIAVNLKMFGQILPTSNEATYLGVIFDSRLTWEHQISKMCERSYTRLNLIRAMAGLSKKHNPNLLLQLYNSTIRSIFEYSSICIVSAAQSHLNKLQLIQNEALRITLKVPSYVSIKTMNDSAGLKSVYLLLTSIAKQKISHLHNHSMLVRETVEKHKNIRNNNYNNSPLDVINF